jgi:hypothetical protein
MKNKSFLFSLVLLGLSIQLFTQEPVTTWGKMLPNDIPNERITKVFGSDDTGYYVARESGPIYNPKYVLEKYSFDYVKEYSKRITTHSGQVGDKLLFRDFLYANDKFLAFYKGWIKAEGKSFYFLESYDLNGEILGNGKELESFTAEKSMNAGTHGASLSPDKTKLLVLTSMPFIKKSKEKVRLRVFDTKTLKELWYKEITLEDESKRAVHNKGFVDNNGNAYIFKKINLPKGLLSYQLLTYSAVDQNFEKNEINLNSKLICEKNISFNSKNDLVITGFYGTKSELQIEGTFYFRVDNKTLKLSAQNLVPLGSKLLENWKTEKNAAKEGAYILKYKIKDVLSLTTGNTLIITENCTQSQKILLPKVLQNQFINIIYTEEILW